MKYLLHVDSEQYVLDFLSRQIGGVSRSKFRVLLKQREIKHNGLRITENILIKQGDVIEAYVPERFQAECTYETVFENADLLIVNKPVQTDVEQSLKTQLEKMYHTLFPVHRLDRNTTGLVMYARSREISDALCAAIKAGRIGKFYRALIAGALPQKEAVLEAYIVKDPARKISRVYDRTVPGSKRIVTKYEVIAAFSGYSEIEVQLITGRTHQIRAHFAYLGHPLIGDGKYGKRDVNERFGCRFQQLAATKIVFPVFEGVLKHLSGKTVEITPQFQVTTEV